MSLNMAKDVHSYRQKVELAVKEWGQGNDLVGLHHFSASVMLLDGLIAKALSDPEGKLTAMLLKLLPFMRQLEVAVVNQDVTSIMDIINYQISPLLQGWEQRMQAHASE